MHRLYTLFENLETKCVDTGMNFYILYSEFVKVHIQRNVTINFWLKTKQFNKIHLIHGCGSPELYDCGHCVHT